MAVLEKIPTVGVRDLKQNASKVIAAVQAENAARVVTVNGRPAVGIVPLGDIVVDGPDHHVTRVGIDSAIFATRMAAFPVAVMGAPEAESWLDDIRSADGPDDVIDPWERAGQ